MNARGDAETGERAFEREGVRLAGAEDDSHFVKLAAVGVMSEDAEDDFLELLIERGR